MGGGRGMAFDRFSDLPRSRLSAREAALTRVIAAAGLCALAVVALTLPVVWNGFVFIYHDSIDYLGLAFTWQMPEFRTAPYGLFAGLARLTGNPATVVLAQSAVVVGILALSVRAQAPAVRFPVAFTVTLLAALSGGISLYASQIMADVFAGAAVLGLVSLMLFAEGLTAFRRWLLAGLCAVAICVHTSHVGLALGLLALGFGARLAHSFHPSFPRVRLREASLAVAGGVALVLAGNAYVTGRPFLTQTATVQALALFVEGGVAKSYLDLRCQEPAGAGYRTGHEPPFKLCAYRETLPRTANEFLWARGRSPLYKLGGWDGMRAEAQAIVDGAVKTLPGAVALQTLDLSVAQFFMLDPGDGLGPRWPCYGDAIGTWFPNDKLAFKLSRQEHGIDFTPLYWPTRAIMGVSLAAVLILAFAGRQMPRQSLFGAAILIAVAGNAFICGGLSNPNHRYQGRMVWLVASSAALMILAQTASGRVRGRTESAAVAGSST